MSDRYGLKTIKTELVDDVLVVTLNRPERRNALSPEMHLELRKLYEAVIDDEEPNAVVLTGEGKYFCVGADFADMDSNLETAGTPMDTPACSSSRSAWPATSSRCAFRWSPRSTATRSASARPSRCSAMSCTWPRRRGSRIRT